MAKKKTSVSLSPTGQELLELLTDKFGITANAIIEMSIRLFAEKENVKLSPVKKEKIK